MTTKKQFTDFVKVLYKLTDSRFKFSMYRTSNDGTYRIEMHFCNKLVADTTCDDIHPHNAVDCLIDLVMCSEHKTNVDYFNQFGVSFEIYHNKLNGKNYFSFRKNESYKWVKISHILASYILECNDIAIDGLCDNVVSYCEYDCYYKVCIKGDA